jgi:hypothetical protein
MPNIEVVHPVEEQAVTTVRTLVFGDLATHEKYRQCLRVAAVVILLDLISKLVALRLAPTELPLELWGGAIAIQLSAFATAPTADAQGEAEGDQSAPESD